MKNSIWIRLGVALVGLGLRWRSVRHCDILRRVLIHDQADRDAMASHWSCKLCGWPQRFVGRTS